MNRTGLIGSARRMRGAPTEAEQTLWNALRRKSLLGLRFRRQRVIGPYIVDFCCLQHHLIVEADGDHHHHGETAAYDQTRTEYLEASGFRVLRFTNHEILADLDSVIERIAEAADPQSPQPPCPSLEG